MSSASKCVASMARAGAMAGLLLGAASTLFAATPLRVCADPNNLPYSNQQQQGFENHLAGLVGNDLGRPVAWVWYPQRGAFFRKTLDAGLCDVVMSVPAGIKVAETTQPYYRSSYVFISRRDRHLHIASLDDPRLRTLRIGVHVLGNQDDSLPPVSALISRGIVRNLVGYSIFGNLAESNPPADLIEGVIHGKVDVAVAWGPLAGYFARQSAVPLDITPIDGDPRNPQLPLTFAISMGVRPGNQELKRQLDSELERRQPEIAQLLASYGIPQLSIAPAVQGGN